MKIKLANKLFLCLIMTSFFTHAQTDSLYLGQTPPGNLSKKFIFALISGSTASERIAISNDGKEIYYDGDGGIKYYQYSGSQWNDAVIRFNNSGAPALSPDGKTIYFGSGDFTKYSTKNDTIWEDPIVFNKKINYWHYLQVTNSGSYYASMDNAQGSIGGKDWSKVIINGTDTTIQSLGLPINSAGNDLDFYVSRDESYIIFSSIQKSIGGLDLFISYQKDNGTWTNPKNMGRSVNTAAYEWGPYVSPDNKYLFFSSDIGNPSYIGNMIYWARIDNIVDSLKTTNFTPYILNAIPDQSDTVGNQFAYTIPDSIFFDDDGNNTLTYSATLGDGNPLPSWLSFNAETKTLSGTATEAGSLRIMLIATDTAYTSASTIFTLKVVGNPTSISDPAIDDNIQVYPNPAKDLINISFGSIQYKIAIVNISDVSGKLITSETYHNLSTAAIDLTGNPKGIYLVGISIDGQKINKKICVE